MPLLGPTFLTLGSPTPTAAEAAPVVEFWVGVQADSLRWLAMRAGQMPRFERLYPQESGAEQLFRRVPPPV